MAKVTAILYISKTLSNGEHPVMIRVSEGADRKYFSFGYSAAPDQWKDGQFSSKRPNHRALNMLLRDKLNEYEGRAIQAESEGKSALLEIKKPKRSKNIYDFIDLHVDRLKKAGRHGNANAYSILKNILQKQHSGDKLTYKEIDTAFLNNMLTWLRAKKGPYGSPLSPNTINTYFAKLNSVFEKAAAEDYISKSDNPILSWSIPKTQKGKKVHLTQDNLKDLRKFPLAKQSPAWHCRNYFLFQYNCLGMRIGDVIIMRRKAVIGDEMEYRMGKTGDLFRFKLSPEAKKILSYYITPEMKPDDFVFPIADRKEYEAVEDKKRFIDNRIGAINKQLRHLGKLLGLNSNLTTHIARHTFASNVDRKLKDPRMMQKLLGHKKLETSVGYAGSLHNDDVDAAIKKLYK